jgi:hypothetical protein
MSEAAREGDISFDGEDPRCNDGGTACEGCLMIGWCIGDYPQHVAAVTEKTSVTRPCRCGPDGCSDSGRAGRVANEAR